VSWAAAASAAVASISSLRLSSKAASLLFMVLRRLAGLERWTGERERETREAAEMGLLAEFADEWRAFFDNFLGAETSAT
jgi:hypothetical protein